jgi:hypothetical protein
MNILQISQIVKDSQSTLTYLQDQSLLKSGSICGLCNVWMTQQKFARRADGYVWRCSLCKATSSIRDGSFFSNQKLDLSNAIYILYFFAQELPLKCAIKCLTGVVCERTIVDWYNMYRDMLSRDLLANPIQLGGLGRVVQIDESLWSGKRKYNVGRARPQQPWIFGALDVQTQKVALIYLENRSGIELISKIERCILPQTTIHSDDWAGYNLIANHPNNYTHGIVVHKNNFVDPITGVHTQGIEGFWGNAKGAIKAMHGVNQNQLPIHMDEIVWRWNNKTENAFQRIIEILRTYYPCGNAMFGQNMIPNRPDIAY